MLSHGKGVVKRQSTSTAKACRRILLYFRNDQGLFFDVYADGHMATFDGENQNCDATANTYSADVRVVIDLLPPWMIPAASL